MHQQTFRFLLLLIGLLNFMPDSRAQIEKQPLTTGSIIYLDPQLEKLIPRTAKIEIIGSGFQHIEGPVWVKDSSILLFSDTKGQTIYRWAEGKKLSKFLENTGFTGRLPYGEEPGSNGLALDKNGNLLIAEHGDRRIAIYPLNGKYGKRTFTDNVEGKRLSSPNDLIVKSDGSVYFTDPPYGLPNKSIDSTKEVGWSGIYRTTKTGATELLNSRIPFPNGLAFSPDEKILYVSNSSQDTMQIWAFPVNSNGRLGIGKVFFNGSNLPKDQPKQVMDGLKADKQGNVWACGPGGLLIISPQGKLLGKVNTREVIANCAWSADGSTLYLAAGYVLCRLKTTSQGSF